MGPRFFNRGNAQKANNARHSFHPSMGPRFFNRGNEGRERVAGDVSHPSMGPRFFNRGNARKVPMYQVILAAFNGAAVFQPRKFDCVESSG